jgi:DNA-binding transcriptional regulator YiaG
MAVAAKVLRHAPGATIRVKPVREWFHLSQEAFAKALGVGRATIARWEAADSGPNANTAEGRLLAALIDSRELAIKMFGRRHAKAWFDDVAPTFHETPRATLVKRGPIPVRDLLMEAWEGSY